MNKPQVSLNRFEVSNDRYVGESGFDEVPDMTAKKPKVIVQRPLGYGISFSQKNSP